MASEELPEIPQDPQLVARMALERLREKGALDVPCPACGAPDRWTVEQRQALIAHLREDGTVAYEPDRGEWTGIAVAYCWCRNCGFIRMHHLQGLFRD
jgi:hypothetical protein